MTGPKISEDAREQSGTELNAARQAAADHCGPDSSTHVHVGQCARNGFDAGVAFARAELGQPTHHEESPFVEISRLIDEVRPRGVGHELQMWRRVTKVCEESGEVWRALSGYVGENPRKGHTHTKDDLLGELLDTASAALCAWAHVQGNDGDPEFALRDHVAGTVDRLRAALTAVHNQRPYRPECAERSVDGQLRGACLADDGGGR